jgi:hypothetical protein
VLYVACALAFATFLGATKDRLTSRLQALPLDELLFWKSVVGLPWAASICWNCIKLGEWRESRGAVPESLALSLICACLISWGMMSVGWITL